MAGGKAGDEHRRGTRETIDERHRRAWERPVVSRPEATQTRETFRVDAPSPIQEVLAKHEAELDVDIDEESEIICF